MNAELLSEPERQNGPKKPRHKVLPLPHPDRKTANIYFAVNVRYLGIFRQVTREKMSRDILYILMQYGRRQPLERNVAWGANRHLFQQSGNKREGTYCTHQCERRQPYERVVACWGY